MKIKVSTLGIASLIGMNLLFTDDTKTDVREINQLQQLANYQDILSEDEVGEQAFKEIFFGMGPNVDRLAEEWNSADYNQLIAEIESEEVNRSSYQEVVQKLTQKIQDINPEIFSTFGNALITSNPRKIEEALTAISGILIDIFKEENGVPKHSARSGFAAAAVVVAAVWSVGAAVNWAAVANALGLTNAYAAVNVKTIVHYKTKITASRSMAAASGEAGEISQQRLVAGIAKVYNASK